MVLDVLKRIRRINRVLDVGCTGSYFPYELSSLGFVVEGLDINPYHLRKPSFQFHVCDLTRTSFPDDYFDAVVAVSTVEHVGLGAYQDPVLADGDRIALDELARILSKGGYLLVTVPYAREYCDKWQRIYNWDILMSILPENLSLVEAAFFVSQSSFSVPDPYSSLGGGKWKQVTKYEIEGRPVRRGVVCLLLEKCDSAKVEQEYSSPRSGDIMDNALHRNVVPRR